MIWHISEIFQQVCSYWWKTNKNPDKKIIRLTTQSISYGCYKISGNTRIHLLLWYFGALWFNGNHFRNWISIHDSVLKCNKNDLFLKRTITVDKIWIIYINAEQNVPVKTKWATFNFHLISIMWCCVSNWSGRASCITSSFHKIIHWIQSSNVSIFNWLKVAIDTKCQKLVSWKVSSSIITMSGPHISL